MAMILSTSAPRQPGPDPLRAVSNIQYQTSLTSSTFLSTVNYISPWAASTRGGGGGSAQCRLQMK